MLRKEGMAVPQAQAVEVDTLLASGKLSVDGEYDWSQSNKKAWYKVTIPVRCEGTKPVALRLAYSVNCFNRTRQTLVLLWNKNIRLMSDPMAEGERAESEVLVRGERCKVTAVKYRSSWMASGVSSGASGWRSGGRP